MAAGGPLHDVDFEIFGRVQGVFFRKHTEREAKRLHLVGWVMNTKKETVKGQVQGPKEKVDEMKKWLKTKGSPQSRIEKAEFKNEKTIDAVTYPNFSIKK